MITLTDDVKYLKGVGPKKAERLAALGIKTAGDLLYLFPREYEDRRTPVAIKDLVPGRTCLVSGTVESVYKSPYRRGKSYTKVKISDGESMLEILYFNAPYVANNLKKGEEYYFYGKVSENRGGARWGGSIQMIHPEFAKGAEGLVPIYPLTKGISQNDIRKLEKSVSHLADQVEDYLPEKIVNDKGLCDIGFALKNIHYPDDEDSLSRARTRIIYDELFIMQIGLLMMKKGRQSGRAHTADEKTFTDSLPYELTGAQKRALGEIARDLADGMAMNRLLQGDVGSGKTAVAEAAMYKVVKSGSQAAFMAPTDLLMKQHYETFSRDFAPHGITVGYLSGHMGAAEKRETLEKMAAGELDIVVGTHALIQDSVSFRNLGLVITDEQHRFGVNQRMSLSGKGSDPDILVMTATPIPRTLAVIFYGDMDVSVIDELPPGRQRIITNYYGSERRPAIYRRLVNELDLGHQVYVVCPLIEDSDSVEARSATSVYEELSGLYKGVKKSTADSDPGERPRDDIRVGLLHGEMKQEEKDAVMVEFAEGNIDVLVSTVVIEVGIDVPNATVMIIENAERFGLSQMHQLRGRVGRGKDQSFCMLILGSRSDIANERAKVLSESSDGFYISERDLDLRGPGEVFGTRQHGLPDTHLADMISHIDIMEELRGYALDILEDDRELAKPENEKLRRRVAMLFSDDVTVSL